MGAKFAKFIKSNIVGYLFFLLVFILLMVLSDTIFAQCSTSVGITASPSTSNCAGANVTFIATPTNAGLSPTYQWMINGNKVGSNTDQYSTTSLTNGDVITCVLTSSAYTSGSTVISNALTMTVTSTWIGEVNTDWNLASNWCGGVPTSNQDVIIGSGTYMPYIKAAGAACKNLTITSSGSLTIERGTLTVTGITSIGGTIAFNNASGSATFGNDVTIAGSWNETAAATLYFDGNLINDGNFTASTGIHNFRGTAKTISGKATSISIAIPIFSGSYTNTIATMSVSKDLAGAGTFIMGANTKLNLFGSTSISTLDAMSNFPNTISYTGVADQEEKPAIYCNLTTKGSGNKTIAGKATTNETLNISSSDLNNSTLLINKTITSTSNFKSKATSNITTGLGVSMEYWQN